MKSRMSWCLHGLAGRSHALHQHASSEALASAPHMDVGLEVSGRQISDLSTYSRAHESKPGRYRYATFCPESDTGLFFEALDFEKVALILGMLP